MKAFLGTFILTDGEHEHYEHLLVKASTKAEADKLFSEQEYCCDEEEESAFGYGDGLTALRFRYSKEIDKAEADIFAKHCVVNYLEG